MNTVTNVTEFANLHITSAFFSGFVFWASLCHLVESPLAQYIKQRVVNKISIAWMRRYSNDGVGSKSDQEAQNLFIKEPGLRRLGINRNSLNESIFRRQDNPTLIFVLTVLFLTGGLSQFASHLTFDDGSPSSSSQASKFCAFLIAWDSMSFQTARLVGLAILGLNLASLGVKQLERLVFWLCVGIIAVLIIISNALGNGTLKPAMPTDPRVIASCVRQHILAPSLVLSLVAIGQEIYCITRFLNIISPPSFPRRRRINTLFKDIRIVRAFSLLVFDLILLVPNAIETTSLGNSLPFSIAALIVLATFNKYHPSLPLFHEVAAQTNDGTGKDAHGEDQRLRYKALAFPRHPYSAAALAASASQLNVSRTGHASGFTTTSRSDAPLLNNEARLGMYSRLDKRRQVAAKKDVLPPIPQENPVPYIRHAKSRSPSKSRSRSRRTRASNRSQKSQLVRPIVPKAELARQFNDSERSDDSRTKVLAPRPTHGRSRSSPIQELPHAVLRSNGSQTRRRSAGASTARTFTSSSIRYGSDILRPEPGRSIRDRMRMPNTRPSSPASVQPPAVVSPSQSSSHDSWLSDTTVNALNVARLVRPEPSLATFSGGWPVPPATIPNSSGNSRVKGMRRPGLPSTPAPARQSDRPKTVVKTEASSSTTQSARRGIQRPHSVVRGPRMPSSPPSIRPVKV